MQRGRDGERERGGDRGSIRNLQGIYRGAIRYLQEICGGSIGDLYCCCFGILHSDFKIFLYRGKRSSRIS